MDEVKYHWKFMAKETGYAYSISRFVAYNYVVSSF